MVPYEEWVATKTQVKRFESIPFESLSPHLFPHQIDLVRWALKRGRAAIFADTGLGKTAMQVEWARIVSMMGRVMILAPLAVAAQTVREAARFGVEVRYMREDDGVSPIIIANYEMLPHFDPSRFVGIILDESSILKSFEGATRNAIIGAFSDTPYRLACTATPAPNDFTELGNHSEFLGVLSKVEMQAEFFAHDGGKTQDWRIKGHAVDAFWRWVCSWGAVVKRPSDLGHDDGGFALPPLRMHEHVVKVRHEEAWQAGFLFAQAALTLSDQRATKRATIASRVEVAADLAKGSDPCLIWCELNDESADVTKLIPGAVEVKGSHTPEEKTDRLLGFAEGRYRVLVTKPSIAGFGMNWQHCNRMIFLDASHSYEQIYQAIRRCWRFGQARPVDVHVIRAETADAVIANFRRKEADAERMSREMVGRMADTLRAEISSANRQWNDYSPQILMTVPAWVREETS